MLDDMKLKGNPLFSHKENDDPRYFMEIEINGTLEGVQKLRLPIFWRPQGGPHTRIKEIYSVQVVNTLIERGNLDDLTQGVKEALLNLVQSGFASYLILLQAGETIPIYFRNGMLSARVMDGPQYQDTDVGRVFCGIRDYLMLFGRIKAPNQMRLNRVSPQACEGRDFGGRNDLFSLRRDIAGYLMENNRIESPCDLRVCDLSFSKWGRLRPTVHEENLCLSYFGGEETKERFQIFSNGEELIAARSLDRGIDLYLGRDMEDLKNRVSRELKMDGSMKTSGSIVVENIEAKTLPTGWREKALKVLELIGKENDLLRLPPEVQEQRLENAFKQYPFFELFYVMDRHGYQATMNIASPKYGDKISTAGKGVSRSFKKYFSEVKETNRSYLSEAYLSTATDSFCITVSIPLKNSFGELEYVLAGDINLDDLGLI
jgi:hypothetical protein